MNAQLLHVICSVNQRFQIVALQHADACISVLFICFNTVIAVVYRTSLSTLIGIYYYQQHYTYY
jgi:hypothetical protein